MVDLLPSLSVRPEFVGLRDSLKPLSTREGGIFLVIMQTVAKSVCKIGVNGPTCGKHNSGRRTNYHFFLPSSEKKPVKTKFTSQMQNSASHFFHENI